MATKKKTQKRTHARNPHGADPEALWYGSLALVAVTFVLFFAVLEYAGFSPSYAGIPAERESEQEHMIVLEELVPAVAEVEEEGETESAEGMGYLPESRQWVVVGTTPTGTLNVRAQPSLLGAIVAEVEPGDRFLLLAEEGYWYEIEYEEDVYGWIHSLYVAEVE